MVKSLDFQSILPRCNTLLLFEPCWPETTKVCGSLCSLAKAADNTGLGLGNAGQEYCTGALPATTVKASTDTTAKAAATTRRRGPGAAPTLAAAPATSTVPQSQAATADMVVVARSQWRSEMLVAIRAKAQTTAPVMPPARRATKLTVTWATRAGEGHRHTSRPGDDHGSDQNKPCPPVRSFSCRPEPGHPLDQPHRQARALRRMALIMACAAKPGTSSPPSLGPLVKDGEGFPGCAWGPVGRGIAAVGWDQLAAREHPERRGT